MVFGVGGDFDEPVAAFLLANEGDQFSGVAKLASGGRAANGYEALAALDDNGDGVITAGDSAWNDLKVWVDGNSDGTSQSGELKSLDSLGISKLNVNATATSEKNNGNWIGLKSGFETTDGATHDMADVWFVAKRPTDAAQPPADTSDALRSSVTGLVQAIAAFNDAGDGAGGASGWNLEPEGSSLAPQIAAAAAPVAGNVAQLVDALRFFDSNGQLVAGNTPSAPFASPGESVTLAAARSPAGAGFLGTDGR